VNPICSINQKLVNKNPRNHFDNTAHSLLIFSANHRLGPQTTVCKNLAAIRMAFYRLDVTFKHYQQQSVSKHPRQPQTLIHTAYKPDTSGNFIFLLKPKFLTKSKSENPDIAFLK